MTKNQTQTFTILVIIGCLLFSIFFWPNGQNAANEEMLLVRSQDEPIIYPYVLKMLSPSQTVNEAWGKLIIYGDYHYGYPFYFFSILVLLPVRIILGSSFSSQTQLNMLLLRQLISVLPMVLSALLMVYLQTRFSSRVKSIMLFLFLFCIGGIIRNNLNWWHPDALAVLFLVLTLFFLDKDGFNFGKYFYFAAVCCGIATAIKLQGVFFAPGILTYLVIAIIQKKITLKKALISALVFILIFCLFYVLSNPFLFYNAPRQRYVDIMTGKNNELSAGYSHDNPIYYQIGPYWWYDTLTRWYGHPVFWIFTFVSLVIGCWKGGNKLVNRFILLFFVPFSLYLLYFVAPKPDHYWLPVVFPFFSVIFTIPTILENQIHAYTAKSGKSNPPFDVYVEKKPVMKNWSVLIIVLQILIYGFILYQWILFLYQDIPLFFSFIDKV